tara:strand:+ start:2658 stop:3314 length:657 start_codon:yes stop_codon:yes gene_type:complete
MKVILVIDHMAKNSMQTPSNRTLRKHSHDLIALYRYLKSFSEPQPNPLSIIDSSEISLEILKYLADFANKSRYYNLNCLTEDQYSDEPLAKWNLIIEKIICLDVPARQIEKIELRSTEILKATQNISFVLGENLDGSQMTHQDSVLLPQYHYLAAKYAVLHVIELVKSLRDLLDFCVDNSHRTARSLKYDKCPVPYMAEFLNFCLLDRTTILRKKKWP